MLLFLSSLTDLHPGFNVFRYVTFRAFMGAGTAFFLSLVLGSWVIGRLRAIRAHQVIRTGGEMDAIGHHKKSETPTMGGLLIIFCTAVAALLWCDPSSAQVWLVLATLIFMGGVGFLDDFLKLKHKNSAGLAEKHKLLLQGLWVFIAYVAIEAIPGTRPYARQLMLPFFKDPVISDLTILGALTFFFLVVIGTTNAVNLTDGLDGLAIGCLNPVVFVYMLLAYVAGHAVFAEYLQVPLVRGAHELAVFCGCLLGAGLGFLWFNAHPAKVFMGDTGSLALGGTLAMVAILIKHEVTLLIAGFVFVAEAGSVLIQRYWFKYTRKRFGTGRRVFLMAPIHHHFELAAKEKSDHSEARLVTRFWVASLLCSMLALSTLKLR